MREHVLITYPKSRKITPIYVYYYTLGLEGYGYRQTSKPLLNGNNRPAKTAPKRRMRLSKRLILKLDRQKQC